jgi:hypothetical protein
MIEKVSGFAGIQQCGGNFQDPIFFNGRIKKWG